MPEQIRSMHGSRGVQEAVDKALALAQHYQVDERSQGKGIRVGERSPRQHKGMLISAITAKKGNAAKLEHFHQPHQLQFIGDGEGQDRKTAQRRFTLVSEKGGARRSVALNIVGEEGSFGRRVGVQVDLSIDRLEAE